MDRPDSELLVRLREGDVSAFDTIFQLYQGRLIGYFFGLSGDRQLSEDCAQEVFVRLYKARETYSPDAALATFVFRIARNYWIDVYRSRKIRPEEKSLDVKLGDHDSESAAAQLPGSGEAPDGRLAHSEDLERMGRAMALLPEIQQSVLSLSAGQGLKYEQVSEVLGIPVGTVKSRVHAAVANLRRLMGEHESEESR